MNRIAIQAVYNTFLFNFLPVCTDLFYDHNVVVGKFLNFERAHRCSLIIEAASLDILCFNHLLSITYGCSFQAPKYKEKSI